VNGVPHLRALFCGGLQLALPVNIIGRRVWLMPDRSVSRSIGWKKKALVKRENIDDRRVRLG
jgi:hypothetical protein